MAELKIVSGPGSGRVVPLEPSGAVRIGRGAPPATPEPGVEHVQIDDKRLSRAHCEVARPGEKWLVRDLGSSNGTFVNGDRVTERILAPGDLVQAGGTIFEVAGLEAAEGEPPAAAEPVASVPEAEAHGEDDPEPPRSAISRSPVRRRRATRSGAAVGYLIFAAGVGLAAWAAYTVLGAGKGDHAPAPVASTRTAQPASSPVLAPSAPLAPDAAAAIEAPLLAGDFRRAHDIVEEILKGPLAGHAAELRTRVNEAATAELSRRIEEAERLTSAGEYAPARSHLEEILPRLPEDLAADVSLALDRVRKLEEASRKSAGTPVPAVTRPPAVHRPPAVTRPPGEPLLANRLVDLQASFQQLSASSSTPPVAWTSLRDEVGALTREGRVDPGFAAEREKLRSLFAACTAKARDPARIRGFFSARRVEWKDGRLTLSYDFTTDEQLRDFHAVGAGSKLHRDGGALALKGECRMLRGDPFEGGLTVRGKIDANGYDSAAPNINLALFTGEGDRLTDDQKAAPSLFTAFVRGTGPEPGDFAAFCLGYRAVTADYGGQSLEQITPDGSVDPVKMPVHAVLAGKRGTLLHTDARECLWAVPAGGSPRGAVDFEIVLDGESVAWKLNGKPLIDAKNPRLSRLRALNEPSGSVTLFTRRSEVRFASIEVEGRLSERWLVEALEASAELELEKIERG